MDSMMIKARGLTKRFVMKKHVVEAVRSIDLEVETGEFVALLGPNGAGKTTTIRMLTTLLPPSAGTAIVAGHDVATEQRGVRNKIGYIGQGNGAGHSQRGRDELVTQGRAYGLSARTARTRADELIDSLELAEVADRMVYTLSGGQRRRLDIAMGLLHAPSLLFLDEPSTGLDPQNRANLREHILRLRAAHGTTILLTTHYLDEADHLAERVVVVDHGQVIADDTPARLKSEHASDRISLGFDNEDEARRAAHRADGVMAGAEIGRIGTTVEIQVKASARLTPRLLRELDDVGIEATEIEVHRPTLDDVFLNLTGRSLREDGVSATTAEAVATEEGVKP